MQAQQVVFFKEMSEQRPRHQVLRKLWQESSASFYYGEAVQAPLFPSPEFMPGLQQQTLVVFVEYISQLYAFSFAICSFILLFGRNTVNKSQVVTIKTIPTKEYKFRWISLYINLCTRHYCKQ
jgi:hypothetical protein